MFQFHIIFSVICVTIQSSSVLAQTPPASAPPLFVRKDENSYLKDLKWAYVKGGYWNYEETYLSTILACTNSVMYASMSQQGDVPQIRIPILRYYYTKMFGIVLADEVPLQNCTEQTFDGIARKTAKEMVNQCRAVDDVAKGAAKEYKAALRKNSAASG